MYTVILPPSVNPIAVNKYIISNQTVNTDREKSPASSFASKILLTVAAL
jgi:hypothetical protein